MKHSLLLLFLVIIVVCYASAPSESVLDKVKREVPKLSNSERLELLLSMFKGRHSNHHSTRKPSTTSPTPTKKPKRTKRPTTAPTTTKAPTTTAIPNTPKTQVTTVTPTKVQEQKSSPACKNCLVFSPKEITEFVKYHNEVRTQAGVGPLEWDDKIASYAAQYANKCIKDGSMLKHNPIRKMEYGKLGENIVWVSRNIDGYDAIYGRYGWEASEKKYYHYSTNSCEPGQKCGHYTQVVWSDSKKVGCARVSCGGPRDGYNILCNYYPAGNVRGRKPY
ncbi:pathogenesis-related protein [Acrasis kona]|uniref:Pathogenesis-related protein n=1 Tax=Acrasis kona TaxID=1008807 RepID=A0AAW2YXZ6_9EUKA